MSSLARKKCEPCADGTTPLRGEKLHQIAKDVSREWIIINEHHVEKEFAFKDFNEALAFTNKVGRVADEQQHHPDIYLSWGKVRIVLWTHKINGLSENDFILAAKIDEIS